MLIKKHIRDIASILSRACQDDTLASLLNDLLGCDANEKLQDDEAQFGERLFDELTALRPDLVKKTQDL